MTREAFHQDELRKLTALSDGDMLQHLIEAKEVSQVTVSEETGISESTISEVLNNKRDLTRKQISALAKYFNVSPLVFNN